MATPTAEKAPPAIGSYGPFGRVWNGERYVRKDQLAKTDLPTPQRVGGRSTATKPTRSDLMALGMNDKLPAGQEQVIDAAQLGDTRMKPASTTNGDGATITSNEPPKYVQYDDWGIARRVNRSTYLEIKRAVDKDGHKLHDSCPLCGGDHPETEWDPNACSAREPLSGFLCPECGKECWPDGSNVVASAQTSTNPAMKPIPQDEHVMEKMALANLYEHIGSYHPRRARAMGIPVNALAYGGSGMATTVGAGAAR